MRMNRLALFSILLVAGLVMGGTATALGANDLLQEFTGKEVVVVAMNDQLKVYEDGKLVKEITLPEGEYTIETPGGHKVVIVSHKMTMLNSIVEKIKVKAKVKEFMFITILSITLILIVDAATVSEEVKASLAWGISLGLGLAIGVFAAWCYFRECLSGKLK